MVRCIFRKRRLLKPPRIKSKTGCPEVDLLTEFHCSAISPITAISPISPMHIAAISPIMRLLVLLVLLQWNSVNESTVNKSSRLLHPICLERNRPNPFSL